MKNIIVILSLLSLLLIGCSEKRIDSTSDESMKSSIETIKESLTEEKKVEFEDAIKAISVAEIGNIFEAAANKEGIQRKIKDKLNGKTADEIITEGNRIIAERKKKEQEQLVSELEEKNNELKELENKMSEAEKAKSNLEKFKVLRSRFYYQKSSFLEEAVIELTVKNETDKAVARAYFEGTLATPGRTVPWVQDSFNYQIPGGLEPGEKTTWKLTPNMFSDWSKAPKDKGNLVLTVNVTRIDGADEQPIYNSEFSDYDKERMEQLKQTISELESSISKY